ncbi:MAG: tetratricopeptide repeat protein [Candidatus Omnitrophica bacterium]|nr:tetratricopeptide repeat protein [Candidatus Omnitrophota bacterium]
MRIVKMIQWYTKRVQRFKAVHSAAINNLVFISRLIMPKIKITEFKCLIGILLFTFLVFSPVMGLDFLKYDDVVHVTGNSLVCSLSFENITRIFKQTVNRIYIPLTTLSFAFEYKIFKYDSLVYHLNNLILHLIVTGLVFRLSRRLGLSLLATSIATLLFSIHPMRVESVAWVTERKDVLYTAFFLGAVHSYLTFIDSKKKRHLFYSYLLGVLSMLAKPMALSLPFILLVTHWYKVRQFRINMIVDKLAHFIYIIPITLITWLKIEQKLPINLVSTILLKMWTCLFYIRKFIFPAELIPIYNVPEPISFANGEFIMSAAAFMLYLGIVVRYFRVRLFMFANLFYIVSIFFLLRNNCEVGWHMHIVADRYMYVPSIGFCIFSGYLIEALYFQVRQRVGKILLVAGVLSGIFFLAFATSKQIIIWENDHVLWAYAEKKNPENHFVKHVKGVLRFEEGRYDKAIEYFTESINLNPVWIRSYYYRGLSYEKMGLRAKAIDGFTQAIERNQAAPEKYRFEESNSYFKRGILRAKKNAWRKALDDFTKTIELDPDNAKAYNNRGLVYYHLSNDQAALNDFDRSLELDPAKASTYVNRDKVYQRLKM